MLIARRHLTISLFAFVGFGAAARAQTFDDDPRAGNSRGLYGALGGEPFPVPAVNLSRIGASFLRARVNYPTREGAGTIVIDPRRHYLYFVNGDGTAMRYGVGVGRQGFAWSGVATVNSMQEWPDWYPPKEMLERQPDLAAKMQTLQSGVGMAGGPHNPLGARALYLWQNNKDTLFRIHGTTEPWTIGTNASSGCIRMINQDVIDLYSRAQVGARVVVLGSGGRDEIAIEEEAPRRANRAPNYREDTAMRGRPQAPVVQQRGWLEQIFQ